MLREACMVAGNQENYLGTLSKRAERDFHFAMSIGTMRRTGERKKRVFKDVLPIICFHLGRFTEMSESMGQGFR
jgi:hypothetical protein